MQCLAFELEPLRKIVLLSIKLAMTGLQSTDNDSMGSKILRTILMMIQVMVTMMILIPLTSRMMKKRFTYKT